MPASVLIPADNRLLGWSLTDLTLYGTQPAGDVVFGPATVDAAAPLGAPPPASGSVPAAAAAMLQTESDRAADETTALLDRGDAQPPLPSTAPLSLPVDYGPAVETAPPAPVVAPLGSGSFIQQVATPLQVEHDHAGAAGAQAGAAALGALAGGTIAAAPLAAVDHVAEAAIAPLAADLTTAVVGVTDTLGAMVQAPVDTLVGTMAALGDGVGAVGDTVGTVVADVGVPELLPSITDAMGVVGTIVDTTPITSFGGTDPAAGLQTLIGMVESSEIFDLGQATTPAVELASAGSILDALAADEAPSALLGDDGHAGDHLLEDHGIHLGS